MFKTLSGKFTFLFWIVFLFIVTPLYLFVHTYFNNILVDEGRSKVNSLFHAIEPVLAFYIAFDQEHNIELLFEKILKENDVADILLRKQNGEGFYRSRKSIDTQDLYSYTNQIKDPFEHKVIATLKVRYFNTNLAKLHTEMLYILLFTFVIGFMMFVFALLYMQKDLSIVRKIANVLAKYSYTKQPVDIDAKGATQEVRIIAKNTKKMMDTTTQHLRELEAFNQQLEQRVQQGIAKQRDQEKLLIHQSRQAAMGEMLESIAHQWRQPLNIIGIASADIAFKRDLGVLSEEVFDEKLEEISKNIQYMSDTIDDFRNFLNPSREEIEFDPLQSVRDVIKIMDAQLRNNNIELQLHSYDALLYYGVANEFKQVLIILLNNAKDAIVQRMKHEQGIKGSIEVSLQCSEQFGVVEVCDNGVGIDESVLEKIFDPYFTTKSKASGTGIGLYMAKNIIESRMKGFISVQVKEKRSCFTIKLKNHHKGYR